MSSQETTITFCGAIIESTRSKEDPMLTPEDFGRLFETQEKLFDYNKQNLSTLSSTIEKTTAQCLLIQAAGAGFTDYIEEYCQQ